MAKVLMLRSVGGRPELVEGKTADVADAAALVAAGLAEPAPDPKPEPKPVPAKKEKGDK